MKKTIILLTIIFFANTDVSIAQSWYRYDGNGNIIDGSHIKIKPKEKIELNDSINNIKYVLDEEHIIVTAYDSEGKVLWKTDPWKDAKVSEYRTKRPIIVEFEFSKPLDYIDEIKNEKLVILISYNNTQAGYLNSKGIFFFMGQD